MGGAQTVEQGQAYAGVEETTVNELDTVNETSATSGLITETVHLDFSGPIAESFGATPAGALEDNEEPVAENLAGTHDPTTPGGFQTGSSADVDAASLPTLGNAEEPGLQIQPPLVASPPVLTMTESRMSNVTSNTIGPLEAQHSAPHSDPLHVANSSFAAGFNAGFQAAIEQAVQYLASQAHGAQATGGYTHQQQARAIERNAGHGEPWIWNEMQSTPALGEAQVSAHGEVVDGLMAEGQVEGSVDTFVQGQQPEMVAEQAMGPGVSPPSSSLAPSAASPQAGMPMGLPILVPGPTADAPIHLPVMEPSPNTAGISVPSPTPTRSSLPVRRSRASAFRGQKRRPYPAVRRPLPRKPRKQSLEPEPVNTSHITYYGYKGWRLVGLNKALRACFPQWEETGFLPQYHVPGVPTMWIPTVAYDVEAPTVQEPVVTPGAETTAVAEPAQNTEHPTFPEEIWRVGQPPVTWLRRSSRTSVFHDSEPKEPLHQGQRPHLLRRRKKCRAPDPTPNTSHITYYGYKIWRLAARKKACRACFPHWEATGFVPQYLVPDVPTLWSPPPADAIAQDIDALALEMQQAAIAEPANAQGPGVAPAVDVPTQGEASEPTATQSTGQAVDELADMFAGVMQNVQNAVSGEVVESGQAEAASAEDHVAEEVEAVAADSDEEDAAEVEAEVQIELDEEDMAAAEAYLNGLGLFGSGGNDT
ncbi:hypothetical protein FRC09_015244 [Ceratobasidium sp. 395]|nr:hypothetical protein FRC09_015244 [Ceratobasidium sp. 395]